MRTATAAFSFLLACMISGNAQADAATTWFASLAAHIDKFKQFPEEARRRGESGVVYIKFSIDWNGKLIDSRIERSSCFEELDQEALATVRRAAPFPLIPLEIKKARINFILPIRFAERKNDTLPLDPSETRNKCLVS